MVLSSPPSLFYHTYYYLLLLLSGQQDIRIANGVYGVCIPSISYLPGGTAGVCPRFHKNPRRDKRGTSSTAQTGSR